MPFFNSLKPAQRRALGWTALTLVALLLLWLLAPVLSPFVAAAVLAYVLAPMVSQLSRRLPRVLAVLLVECMVLLVAASLLLLLVPIVTRELPLLREQLPLLAGKLNDWLAPWLQRLGVPMAFDVPAQQLTRGSFFDLAKADKALAAGGTYRLSVGEKNIVFKVDTEAKPGMAPLLSRLIRL